MQAVCAYSPQVVIQSSFRVRELTESWLIEQVLSENEIGWKELAFSKQILSENEIDWEELAFSKQIWSENEVDVWEWDWLKGTSLLKTSFIWECDGREVGGGGGGFSLFFI